MTKTDSKKLYALMCYSSMTDEYTAFMSYDKKNVESAKLQKMVKHYLFTDDEYDTFADELRDAEVIIGAEYAGGWYGKSEPFGEVVGISDTTEGEYGEYIHTNEWYAEIGGHTLSVEIVNEFNSRY